jgi:hypothetical protein
VCNKAFDHKSKLMKHKCVHSGVPTFSLTTVTLK